MILWFSGTGNSRFVAERLALLLNQRLTELRPAITATPLTLPDDDNAVYWVFPVYSWGVPPYIRSVIRDISLDIRSEQTPVHHLILTCGDDCGLAAGMWRKDIRSRGWTDGNAYSVIMPNNYVCMKGFDVDPKALEEKKLAEAPARIEAIAEELRSYSGQKGRHDDIVQGNFAWIKTKVIYPWFVRHEMSPKPFHYTKDCISCGKCAAACPLRNISMQPDEKADASGRRRKHPVWDDNCAGCLRCYHICPRHAVMYGKSTLKKGQYFNPFV